MGNRVCGHKELEDEDPDTAWQKQNKAQSEKSMYKIINLQNGGTLLETFKEMRERNDLESFKEIAAKELPPYLYNGGEDTHLITKTEYVMYLKMCAKQVATIWTDEKAKQLGEEFDKRQEGQFRNKFQEHEACFDLDNRGGVGETILHLCYLNNSDIHKELAKVLIEKYPKMVLDIYEGYEYYGESCLHLAIVNQDLESVKFLVEKGARLDQRASGRFFLPEAHKDGSAKGKDIDYFGYAYYGEYPLHFAASVANEDIYTYLLEKSNPLTGLVDPNAQDSFGNTALHMLVIHNKPEMYKLVLERADPEIRNVSGLTPLGLACKLGRNKLFQQILEVNSTTFWKFSNFHCVAYPLDNIDSIKSNGDHDWDSALSIIVGSNKDEHLPMLDGGVIHLLLLEKWRVFAKRQFTIRLTFAIIYLLTLSVAIYTRPAGDLIGGTDVKSIVRYVAEALTTIGCLIYLGLEFFHIKTVKLGYFSTMRNVPAKGLFLFSCVLILLCVPMRFLDKRYIEDMLVIAAVPLAWTYILFFYRVLESLGPFVTMIYKMIAGDLFRFSLITITILSSFSPAFYFLFKDIGVYVFTFDTVYGTWMSLFHMAFGEFATLISGKDDEIELSRSPILTKLIFVIFMLLVPILLLSMLIAMMTNTYQKILVRSRKEWQRQWAKIVVVMERSCTKQHLQKYQQLYSIDAPKPKSMAKKISESTATMTHSSNRNIGSMTSFGDASSYVSTIHADGQEEDEMCPALMIVKPITNGVDMKTNKSKLLFRGQSGDSDDDDESQMSLRDWKVVSSNARQKLAIQGTKGSKSKHKASEKRKKSASFLVGTKPKSSISVEPLISNLDGSRPVSRHSDSRPTSLKSDVGTNTSDVSTPKT